MDGWMAHKGMQNGQVAVFIHLLGLSIYIGEYKYMHERWRRHRLLQEISYN